MNRGMFKKLGILMFVLSYFSFANSVETNFTLEPIFSQRYKSENTYPSKFRYENTSYKFKLLDLTLDGIKNLNFNFVLASSRKNISLNDFAADTKHYSDLKKRDANHDIMAKFKLAYDFEIAKDIVWTNSITYYLDNFWTKKVIDKDGNIVEDAKTYYVVGDDKNALGNTIFDSKLKAKVDNTDLNLALSYKANQLHRFDKDESFFKIKFDSNSKINEALILGSKYNFFIDLDLMNRKFDSFDTDFDEYPDTMVGNYVTYFKHNFDLNVKKVLDDNFKDDEDKQNYFNTLFEVKHEAFLVGGNTKDKPINTEYNVVNVGLTFERQKAFDIKKGILGFNVQLTPGLEFKHTLFKADETKNNVTYFEMKVKPTLDTKIFYEYKGFKASTNISYTPHIMVLPYVLKTKDLTHTLEGNLDLGYEKEFSEVSSLHFNTKNSFSFELRETNDNPKYKYTNEVELTYENKLVQDKLKLKFNAKNNFDLNINTNQKILNPDTLKEVFEVTVNADYDFTKQLKLENELKFKDTSSFNYILNNHDKPLNGGVSNYGESNLVYTVNTLKYTGNVVSTNKLKENVEIISSAKLNADIETLIVRNEKVFNYNTSDIESYKEKPLVSDYRKTLVNFGGRLVLTPKVEVRYKALENLVVSTSLASELLFEKNVLNIIKDEDRPDNGQFGAVDKQFDFRHLKPIFNVSVKYNW